MFITVFATNENIAATGAFDNSSPSKYIIANIMNNAQVFCIFLLIILVCVGIFFVRTATLWELQIRAFIFLYIIIITFVLQLFYLDIDNFFNNIDFLNMYVAITFNDIKNELLNLYKGLNKINNNEIYSDVISILNSIYLYKTRTALLSIIQSKTNESYKDILQNVSDISNNFIQYANLANNSMNIIHLFSDECKDLSYYFIQYRQLINSILNNKLITESILNFNLDFLPNILKVYYMDITNADKYQKDICDYYGISESDYNNIYNQLQDTYSEISVHLLFPITTDIISLIGDINKIKLWENFSFNRNNYLINNNLSNIDQNSEYIENQLNNIDMLTLLTNIFNNDFNNFLDKLNKNFNNLNISDTQIINTALTYQVLINQVNSQISQYREEQLKYDYNIEYQEQLNNLLLLSTNTERDQYIYNYLSSNNQNLNTQPNLDNFNNLTNLIDKFLNISNQLSNIDQKFYSNILLLDQIRERQNSIDIVKKNTEYQLNNLIKFNKLTLDKSIFSNLTNVYNIFQQQNNLNLIFQDNDILFFYKNSIFTIQTKDDTINISYESYNNKFYLLIYFPNKNILLSLQTDFNNQYTDINGIILDFNQNTKLLIKNNLNLKDIYENKYIKYSTDQNNILNYLQNYISSAFQNITYLNNCLSLTVNNNNIQIFPNNYIKILDKNNNLISENLS